MKKLFLIYFASLSINSFAAPAVNKNIPQDFFNHLDTNFESIWLTDASTEQFVKELYQGKHLNHFLEDSERKHFDDYWKLFKNNWHFVDLNKDGEKELLFEGKYELNDESDYIEIYALNDTRKYTLKHVESGILKAFNTNPHTGEIVLYQHQYPCCLKYIHSIYKIRFIAGEIMQSKKNFIARDSGDMKGDFFPEEFKFKHNYLLLEKETQVYWSNDTITNEAFFNSQRKVNSNEICFYPKGTYFKVLYQQTNWAYVLINGRAYGSKNRIVNTDNLFMRPIFGWIQLKTNKL